MDREKENNLTGIDSRKYREIFRHLAARYRTGVPLQGKVRYKSRTSLQSSSNHPANMSVRITHYEIHGLYHIRCWKSPAAHSMLSRRSVSHKFDRGWHRCDVCAMGFRLLRVNHSHDISRNTSCDYSSAYVSLYTSSDLVGHGMTFTIGRGNEIVRVYTVLLKLCTSSRSTLYTGLSSNRIARRASIEQGCRNLVLQHG